MIAERFLGEPPERLFIDFCTIAKISVVVLDEKYHGEDDSDEFCRRIGYRWIDGWMNG